MEWFNALFQAGGVWALLGASGWVVAWLLWRHHKSFLDKYDAFVKDSLALMTRVQIFLENNTSLLQDIVNERKR